MYTLAIGLHAAQKANPRFGILVQSQFCSANNLLDIKERERERLVENNSIFLILLLFLIQIKYSVYNLILARRDGKQVVPLHLFPNCSGIIFKWGTADHGRGL